MGNLALALGAALFSTTIGFRDPQVSEVRADGEVYNLEQVSDFEGLYVAAKANIAIIRGPSARTMRNENGVVVPIDSVQKGAKLTLAAEGVRINLLQQ